MNNSSFLGENKISKLLLKFSIPCILSLLIGALYNIADQIFIGNSSVGFLGNTATTVVYPITVVALAIALFLGDGAAAFISLCLGKGENEKIHKSVGITLVSSIILSAVLILIVALAMNPILHVLGGTDGVNNELGSYELAKSYCTIILFGVPFYIVGTSLGPIIRSDGNPKYAMLATLCGAVINIILDPIFIFVFNLGIEGAAYATIIGQISSFVLTFIYLFKAHTFKLNKTSFVPDFKILGDVLKLGISSFLTQISIVIMSVVTNIVLKKYGTGTDIGSDIPVAIYGIIMKVYGIVISLIVGVAVGGQPIVGYNFGAGKFDRVRKTYYYVFGATVVISLIFFILFETVPGVIIGLFGSADDAVYMDFGTHFLRIYLLLIIPTCILKVSSIYLQALGNPLKATILSLSRDIVMLVPLTIILPMSMGIEGVLWAAPISDVVGIIITVVLVVLELKKLRKFELNK